MMSDNAIEAKHVNDKVCWDRMLLRASSDPEFRKKLLTKPNEALLSCGIKIAESVKITVHEFDPSHQHIFLPPLGSAIAKPAITRLNQNHKENKGGSHG
jgi:hypothetical protein